MNAFVVRLPKNAKKRTVTSINKENDPAFTNSPSGGTSMKKKKLQQQFIDIGQSTFGLTVNCEKCGMLYVGDDEEDITKHKAFCLQSENAPVTLARIPDSCIIERPSDNQTIFAFAHLDSQCSSVIRDLEKRVYPLIRDDLGTPEGFMNCDPKRNSKVFGFSQDRSVLGLLCCEEVDRSCIQLLTSLENISNIDRITEPNGSGMMATSSSASSSHISLGVRVIWVHKKHRGRKIATHLMDIARKHFSFGMVFDKINVAFSQPTEAGLSFAQKYMESAEVRAYSST